MYIASCLLSYFIICHYLFSVYTVESMTNVPDFSSRTHNQSNLLVIAEEDLLRRLSQLNTSKAMGPDGIHRWLLKEDRYGLCKPLTMLYNLSLKCGKLPQDWKQALVAPIFKKRSRYDPNNHRLVSLTS